MMATPTSKIFPHLWYAREAEEAARFYHYPNLTSLSTPIDSRNSSS